jgi:hypothetical protein
MSQYLRWPKRLQRSGYPDGDRTASTQALDALVNIATAMGCRVRVDPDAA